MEREMVQSRHLTHRFCLCQNASWRAESQVPSLPTRIPVHDAPGPNVHEDLGLEFAPLASRCVKIVMPCHATARGHFWEALGWVLNALSVCV